MSTLSIIGLVVLFLILLVIIVVLSGLGNLIAELLSAIFLFWLD
jgi:putative effector of murein hydrolase LrgA (UPF0299 family)